MCVWTDTDNFGPCESKPRLPDQVSHPYQTRCICWRMASSGMLHRVAFVRTDVSEALSASIIMATRIGEPGTTLAVTSNRSTLRRNKTAFFIVTAWKPQILHIYFPCNIYKPCIIHVTFEVFTAVTMINAAFWDITSCGSSKNRVSEEPTASIIRMSHTAQHPRRRYSSYVNQFSTPDCENFVTALEIESVLETKRYPHTVVYCVKKTAPTVSDRVWRQKSGEKMNGVVATSVGWSTEGKGEPYT
jgi:hypothetical protein